MSVLVYIETSEGSIKKASVEAAAYGAKVAELTGGTAIGVAVGSCDKLADLGAYGLSKVLHVTGDAFAGFDATAHTDAVAAAAEAAGATVIVVSQLLYPMFPVVLNCRKVFSPERELPFTK